MSWLLATVALVATTPKPCQQVCVETNAACYSRCVGDAECTHRCASRVADCQAQCKARLDAKEQALLAKGSKCRNSQGKGVPCPADAPTKTARGQGGRKKGHR